MPSRKPAGSGQRINDCYYQVYNILWFITVYGLTVTDEETEIEELTREIEQHDHLMENSAFSEQLRWYSIIS